MQDAHLIATVWLRQNLMVINTSKSSIVILGHPNYTNYNNIKIHIDNSPISQSDSTKLLGMVIDSHLAWKDHVQYILKKKRSPK